MIAILILAIVPAVSGATTLEHGQCSWYYEPADNNTFTQVKVCGPDFPKINKKTTLNEENPIQIYPEYNYTVQIADDVFKAEASVGKRLNSIEQSITELENDISSVESDLADEKEKRKESDNSLSSRIDSKFADLDSRLTELSNDVSNIQRERQNSERAQVDWLPILAIVGVLLLIAAVWVLFKAGIVEPPRFGSSAFGQVHSHHNQPGESPPMEAEQPDRDDEDEDEDSG